MMRAKESDIVQELLSDYLWKAGIVLVLAIVAVAAMVVIWRRAGRTGRAEGRKDRDAQDR